MTDRFSALPVARGAWKGLANSTRTGRSPDKVALAILIVVPVLVGVTCFALDWHLSHVDPLLAGVALLSGVLLSSFAHLATWRSRLVEREERFDTADAAERDSVDEAVALILWAALVSMVAAALIVIAQNAAPAGLGRPWASLVLVTCTHVFLLFLIIVPKLYASYVRANRVPDHRSGFVA